MTGSDRTETGLRLEALSVRRGAVPIVALDARIAPGEVLTLMGPSGSGKTTALAAVLGALPHGFAASGRVILNGRDVTALPVAARRIGILFQDDLLFPHLSVGGNLAFALPTGGSRAARTARIEAALAEMGLAGFAERDPATLSGGQRARVALARALLADPHALLLDEPFSRLDQSLRAQVRALVFGRLAATGLPAILVTHDPEDARAAGGRVLSPMGEVLQP